jgi:hypothetical protein
MTTLLTRDELLDLINARHPPIELANGGVYININEDIRVLEQLQDFQDEFYTNNGNVDEIETDIDMLDFPEVLANLRAVEAHQHRAVSRQDIIQKMNYRQLPAGERYADNFNIGLRDVLAEALTLPRTTTGQQYKEHFNYEKLWDTRRYLCGYDEDKAEEREQMYPELLDDLTDDERDARWGQLAGKFAAVRWLFAEDRSCAEQWFPFLDM